MLQSYVARHSHTQALSDRITGAPAAAASNLVCFNTSFGRAVSATNRTYLFNTSVTGLASVHGYYIAQLVNPVFGYAEMVSVCSTAIVLSNLPKDCVVMPFHTYLDLSAFPNIPINDPSITWLPVGYTSQAVDSSATPALSLTIQECFPVENDRSNALYFGIAMFGLFGATARTILGSVSLRQVNTEYAVFQPNK